MADFDHILIVGLGLIGCAFGQRVAQHFPDVKRSGVEPKPQHRGQAVSLGAVTDARPPGDLPALTKQTDLVLLAAPPRVIRRELLAPVLANARPGSLIVDVASTKQAIVDAAREIDSEAWFIGGHPIAGSERSGPAGATPELLSGASFILCPPSDLPNQELQRLTSFLEALSFEVVTMTAELHDRIVARTSHLVQLTASALAAAVARWCHLEGIPEGPLKALIGSGFRDTTRLAESDPALWKQILASNQGEVAMAVKELQALLGDDWSDVLERGRQGRRQLLDEG